MVSLCGEVPYWPLRFGFIQSFSLFLPPSFSTLTSVCLYQFLWTNSRTCRYLKIMRERGFCFFMVWLMHLPLFGKQSLQLFTSDVDFVIGALVLADMLGTCRPM